MASSGPVQVINDQPAASLSRLTQGLREGGLSVRLHVESTLESCHAWDPLIRAWAHRQDDGPIGRARKLDALSQQERQASRLFGLTVGIKDIIDTADWPTECGTALHAGRRPTVNAAIVDALEQNGAVLLGKTVTTELATYAPGPTRNPWNARHTPGGSSSGSAAAVACGMADLAIGTQTNGSIVRPASFCGVWGFKPSRSLLPRTGVLIQSPSFDALGFFSRELDGITALHSALCLQLLPPLPDDDSVPTGTPHGMQARRARRLTPHWISPFHDRLSQSNRDQWNAWQSDNSLPALTDTAWLAMPEVLGLHRRIMEAEIARSFADEWRRGSERLSDSLRGQILRGKATTDAQYEADLSQLALLKHSIDARWPPSVSAVVMPSTLGAAPLFERGTGDPICCTWASALDLPALNVPVLMDETGLPLGVQVVARRGADRSLLALMQQWVAEHKIPSRFPSFPPST